MNGKKALPITLEVIALAILTIGSYFGMLALFITLINTIGDRPVGKIFLILIPVLAVMLDAIYISTIKLWPFKNIHIKIVLALLLFTFSAAVATCCVAIYMFKGFGW